MFLEKLFVEKHLAPPILLIRHFCNSEFLMRVVLVDTVLVLLTNYVSFSQKMLEHNVLRSTYLFQWKLCTKRLKVELI